MAWDSKYPAFGVIKIQGDKVHLYSSRDNYHTLTIGKPITNAVLAGNSNSRRNENCDGR